MRGLTPTSGWTHLIPGMIVSRHRGRPGQRRRWSPPPSASSNRPAPAWPPASTPRCARSGSRPASPRSARSSPRTFARPCSAGCMDRPRRPRARDRARGLDRRDARRRSRRRPHRCAAWSRRRPVGARLGAEHDPSDRGGRGIRGSRRVFRAHPRARLRQRRRRRGAGRAGGGSMTHNSSGSELNCIGRLSRSARRSRPCDYGSTSESRQTRSEPL